MLVIFLGQLLFSSKLRFRVICLKMLYEERLIQRLYRVFSASDWWNISNELMDLGVNVNADDFVYYYEELIAKDGGLVVNAYAEPKVYDEMLDECI